MLRNLNHFAIFIGLLWIGVCSKSLDTDCENHECPANQPYCTPLGCAQTCPFNYFINGTRCVSSCDTVFIMENRLCQAECPTNYFIKEEVLRDGETYRLNKYCVNNCGVGAFVYNRTCTMICPHQSRYVHGINCVPECPQDKIYAQQRPMNITYCVASCDNIRSFIFNNACLSSCPEQTKYLDGRICATECPITRNVIRQGPDNKMYCSTDCNYGMFQDGICVTSCASDRFVFNKTCVKTCPEEAKLVSYEKNINICTTKCKNSTINLNGKCVHCSRNESIYNQTCFSRCPHDNPFINEFRDTGDSFSYTACVNKCPDDYLIHDKRCVRKCPNNTYIFDKMCLLTCPEQYPVAVERSFSDWSNTHFNCEPTCPNAYICFCPSEKPFLYNAKCISECPLDAKFTRQIKYTQICTPVCNGNEVVFNQRCLISCPSDSNKVFNYTCMEICPTKYVQHDDMTGNDICTYECAGVIYNKTNCVNNCPDNKKYEYNKTCSETCPQPMVITEVMEKVTTRFLCVKGCSNPTPILNDRNCVSQCPMDKEFMFNNTCLHSCPTKYVDSQTCVHECPDKKYVLDDIYCVEDCPQTMSVYNKTCLKYCPTKYFYLTEKTFPYNSWWEKRKPIIIKTCVDKCPDRSYPFIVNDRECVDTCPENQSYVYNQTCLMSCLTKYVDYDHLDVQLWKFTNACVDKCPDNKYILNDRECVRNCPVIQPYVYNQTCLISCPTQFVEEDKRCVDTCSDLLYILNGRECVGTCPHEKAYNYNKTCLESCPTRFSDNHACVDQCPKNKYIFNNSECVTQCPSTHNYIHNGTCVNDTCTPQYAYTRRSTPNVVCVDSCPKDAFINSTSSCVDVCPRYHFQSKCVNDCPHLIDPSKHNECVSSCSKYISNGTCLSECPVGKRFIHGQTCLERCPQNTFADKSFFQDKTDCFDECPYDWVKINNTCISKSACRNEKKSIVFNDDCLRECPHTYVWIGTCVDRKFFYIPMIIICVVLLLSTIRKMENIRTFCQLIRHFSINRRTKSFNYARPIDRLQESRLTEVGDDNSLPVLESDYCVSHSEGAEGAHYVEHLDDHHNGTALPNDNLAVRVDRNGQAEVRPLPIEAEGILLSCESGVQNVNHNSTAVSNDKNFVGFERKGRNFSFSKAEVTPLSIATGFLLETCEHGVHNDTEDREYDNIGLTIADVHYNNMSLNDETLV